MAPQASSAPGELALHTGEVAGSIPAAPTTKTRMLRGRLVRWRGPKPHGRGASRRQHTRNHAKPHSRLDYRHHAKPQDCIWAGSVLLSHGENRGSSPLGSANSFRYLRHLRALVSNACPINVYGQRWTSSRTSPHIQVSKRVGGSCSSIFSPRSARRHSLSVSRRNDARVGARHKLILSRTGDGRKRAKARGVWRRYAGRSRADLRREPTHDIEASTGPFERASVAA